MIICLVELFWKMFSPSSGDSLDLKQVSGSHFKTTAPTSYSVLLSSGLKWDHLPFIKWVAAINYCIYITIMKVFQRKDLQRDIFQRRFCSLLITSLWHLQTVQANLTCICYSHKRLAQHMSSLYKGSIERRSSLGRQFPLSSICRLTLNCNCNKLFPNSIDFWLVKYDTKMLYKKYIYNSIKAAILYTFYILTICECWKIQDIFLLSLSTFI